VSEPRTVDIYRAQDLGPNTPVDPVIIRIVPSLPEISSENYVKDSSEQFRQQGKLLCDALLDALPGGTVDALLAELHTRKASMFRVPFR
jgi:hypothetical protein